MPQPVLDTLRQVETPEGIQLSLAVAGPVARARAWLYDLMIKAVAVWVGALPLALMGDTGTGLYLIFLFLLTWMYPVFFEVLREGRTPGKQIVGLRVVHHDGLPVGWSASLIRSVLGYVDMLPFGYAVGLLTTLLNADSKRLGDLAAGTVVVYTKRSEVHHPSFVVQPERPRVPLDVEEQHGLVEFAARANRMSQARLEELAGLARPLVPDAKTGRERVQRLLSVAHWITGGRA